MSFQVLKPETRGLRNAVQALIQAETSLRTTSGAKTSRSVDIDWLVQLCLNKSIAEINTTCLEFEHQGEHH
jgi:hypothetical protein